MIALQTLFVNKLFACNVLCKHSNFSTLQGEIPIKYLEIIVKDSLTNLLYFIILYDKGLYSLQLL